MVGVEVKAWYIIDRVQAGATKAASKSSHVNVKLPALPATPVQRDIYSIWGRAVRPACFASGTRSTSVAVTLDRHRQCIVHHVDIGIGEARG